MWLWHILPKLWNDRRGGIAVLFGITAPMLMVLLCGGTEVAEVVKAKRELQWDVDTAALNGARELGTDQSSATAVRAQNLATSLATQSTPRWSVVTTSAMDATGGSVTVDQTASRASFFGNILPPGGWHLHVTSTAVSNAKAPLCVLGLQSTTGQVVSLQSTSKVTAAGCLVQSDADIAVSSSATMQASAVHSVGAAQGPISPSPITDAPAIADPFASLSISVPSQCTDSGIDVGNGSRTLNPGVHCGNVQIQGSGTLTLNPGDHYFVNTSFNVNGNAKLLGSDVVLVLKGTTQVSVPGQCLPVVQREAERVLRRLRDHVRPELHRYPRHIDRQRPRPPRHDLSSEWLAGGLGKQQQGCRSIALDRRRRTEGEHKRLRQLDHQLQLR